MGARMRVGILGAGWWASLHAQAIATLPGFEVAAVSSASLTSAQEFAAQYGAQAYADATALLHAEEVDAVLVAAPHEFHRTLALPVIAARKPLLLEKPVATTAEDTHAILNAARAAGVPCLVGFTNHYFPGFKAAYDLIQGGELGRPVSGYSVFQKFWMEHNRRDWHLDRARGGGMLLTAGIHALDRLLWLLDAPVQAVSAVIGTRLHEQQADDIASLFLRLAGGASGLVGSYGYAQGGPMNSTTILCERGALRATADTLEVGRDDRWTPVPLTAPADLVLDALAQEWLDLQAWVQSGRTPLVTPQFAGQVMDVVFAAEQSSQAGREVRLSGD